MKKERKNKPKTITLSFEAKEGVEILKEERGFSSDSEAIDYAIKEAIKALGYSLKEKK